MLARPFGYAVKDTSRTSELPLENIQMLQARRQYSGFGGLEVAFWPLVPKFPGSHPAEAVGFLGQKKNPQYAFLQRRSKAVRPMS